MRQYGGGLMVSWSAEGANTEGAPGIFSPPEREPTMRLFSVALYCFTGVL